MFFFLLETLKTTFKMRNLTQDGHNQGIFSQNLGTFFQFLKKGRGDLPPSPLLVTRLSLKLKISLFILETVFRMIHHSLILELSKSRKLRPRR